MGQQFTIIDGYNLMHVNGFVVSPAGPGSLEKARNLLLGVLAGHLDDESRKRTTIVFDSREADLPRQFTSHEMLVEFANDFASADELIALRIRQHSAPKQLTIVSSDHQIQRVAKARGAVAIDSDQWLESIADPPRTNPTLQNAGEDKPEATRGKVDIDYWKRHLDLDNFSEEEIPAEQGGNVKSPGQEEPPELPESDSIFPPGYADDLFEEP